MELNRLKQRVESGWLVILLISILLGAVVRLQFINAAHNVDEPNIILRAVTLADGEYHVLWYNWPAQSLIRLDGSIFTGFHQLYSMTHPGAHYSTQDLYEFHPQFFITTAHVVTAVFGLLSLVIMFGIGYVMRGPVGGLAAAWLLSLNYLSVLHSRFATPDVPVVFFLLCNVFIAVCVLRYRPNHKLRRWLWMLAGGVVGAAVATKYTGALAGVPIGLVVIWNVWKPRQKCQLNIQVLVRWTLSIGGFLLAAWMIHWLLNPFFLNDFQMITRRIFFEAGSSRLGVDWSGQHHFFLNLAYYLRGSLAWNGTLLSLIGWLTMITSIYKWKSRIWQPVLLVGITYLIFLCGLSTLGLHWSRWSLPLTPLLLVCTAFGLAQILSIIFSRPSWWLKILAFFLLGIVVFPPTVLSLLVGPSTHSLSTSQVMSNYITQHVPSTSRLVADMDYLSTGNPLHIAYHNTDLYDMTLAEVKKSGVEYVVVKRKHYTYAKAQPELYSNIIDFYKELRTGSTLLVKVSKQQDTLFNHKTDLSFYQHLPLFFASFHSETATQGATLELYKINKINPH